MEVGQKRIMTEAVNLGLYETAVNMKNRWIKKERSGFVPKHADGVH